MPEGYVKQNRDRLISNKTGFDLCLPFHRRASVGNEEY